MEKIKGLKGLAITVNIRPTFRDSLLFKVAMVLERRSD